jgi:hypothetical protein
MEKKKENENKNKNKTEQNKKNGLGRVWGWSISGSVPLHQWQI